MILKKLKECGKDMNVLNTDKENFRKTPDNKTIGGASHTCRVLNHKERHRLIIKAVVELRKLTVRFDSIACCGVSGLMVVPQIAELLDKHILVVRKETEERYSDFDLEGVIPESYIIIDDLICSGNTVKYIKNTIYEECPRAKCFGVYSYIPSECVYGSNLESAYKSCKAQLGITYLNSLYGISKDGY